MSFPVNERQASRVALVSSTDARIETVRDALDLIANVRFQGFSKLLLRKEQLTEDFFELKTGIAGEILQKFVTYHMRAAVVGEYHHYDSKSLRDFLYESNKGKQVFFYATEAEALDALHALSE
ncbi:DUF4180 domain-containing protein [Gorillibacterium sp. CAU 1737]|uniref:DUF4180 domain-containing protein n=1 Tax=Gorillibacterium sp. CAU 1737 TaxID=3140362 RepID=UPI0032609D39